MDFYNLITKRKNKMTKKTKILFLMLLSFAILKADEGMWTLDNPPMKQLKENYGFEPTKEWLEHIRLSSVRFNDGGSGSFVSKNGLVLTNHHVALGQLQKLSSEKNDYVKNGFYASTENGEVKCPDLELNVLVEMENITERILSSVKNEMSEKEALESRKSEIAKAEKESTEKTGLRSDVVALYNGGEYWLYRYKKYTDVRLVFAPEQQIAFFGGDPDNFTFPRYDLDMAIFRVYENNKPFQTKNYLKWNSNGATENELVFVSGHPGSTNRLQTMAQMEFNRDYVYPLRLKNLKYRIDALKKYSSLNSENARRAKSMIFSLENSQKALTGEYNGLKDKNIVLNKQDEENEFRGLVNSNPAFLQKYGNAWNSIDSAYKTYATRFNEIFYSSFAGSQYAGLSLQIVRYVTEIKKEDLQRLDGFHESQLQSLKFRMLSPAPIYSDLEEFTIAARLTEISETLGNNNPFLQTILEGKSISEVAKELASTQIGNVEFRKKLVEGGENSVNISNDPMIILMRKLEPIFRANTNWLDENVTSIVTSAGEKIGKARFAVYGKTKYPDATFTLRLAYGSVKGYPYNGTIAPYKTTYYGLFGHSADFDNKGDFELPNKIAESKNEINMTIPLNFVSTCDIIGGNSGSPVVNKEGEIVGLIFDGNIESLVGRFLYDETANRAVSVHTGGMMEAMKNIYKTNRIVEELEGK